MEVANHKSPFEKFLTSQVADMQEVEVLDADFDELEIEVLPKRQIIDKPPKKKTKQQSLRELNAKERKNKKRREARRWRERAEAIGIERPKQGRQSPAQREAWQEKVINREKALNLSSSGK